MKRLLFRYPHILIASLIILSFYLTQILFFYDIGINTKYHIKKDFQTAFLFRKTGNCEKFTDYVLNQKTSWYEKCRSEKLMYDESIEDFKVIAITQDKSTNKAFLQIEIKRTGQKNSYTVNYEMSLNNGRWLISQDLKK